MLVIDTATRTGVIAIADSAGRVLAADHWTSAHRHGEELLSRLDALLAQTMAQPTDLATIVVGTGPGSFTGLRIGLATAKTLAYGLGVPLVGVSTTHALALVGQGELIVTLPAGARDRYVARLRVSGSRVDELAPPSLVGSAAALAALGSLLLVAVDLEPPDVPATAAELGRRAVDGLPAALARLGAAALADGRRDDVAELVPAYVAMPRGIVEAAASVEWSPDLR